MARLTNTTAARIGANATVHAGSDVVVLASDSTHATEISGALSIGLGGAGVGGSVGLVLLDKTTDATIGAGAHVDALGAGSGVSGVIDGTMAGGGFGTKAVHGVVVQAQSDESLLHIIAAASGGFYAGVAGAVGVAMLTSDTSALIDNNAAINQADPQNANASQGVYVTASNNVSVQSYVVGVAGGFVGAAGAVDVGTLNNNTAAEIRSGTAVRAAGDIEVNAVGAKDLTGVVISGAGGAVGVGASVNVWSIGSQLTGSYSDNGGNSANATQNSRGSADGNAAGQSQSASGMVTGGSGLGTFSGSGSNANSSANRVNAASSAAGSSVAAATPGSASLQSREVNVPPPSGTSALIHSGTTIVAGGNIRVTARETLQVSELLGQVSGGVVGAGASVDVITIADNVTAADDGANAAGGTIAVNAVLASDQSYTSMAMQAGFVGIGAGVIVVNDASVTQATLGSVSSAGSVSVSAASDRSIDALVAQANIGYVGAGATFAQVTVGGATTATVDANAVIGSGAMPVGALAVRAQAAVSTRIDTYALAVGIYAGTANFSFVTVDPDVSAVLGTGVSANVSGAVVIAATAVLDIQAYTFGVAAGEFAVGASLVDITLAQNLTASVGASDVVTAGALSITAQTYLPSSGYTALADATGSAGALVGVTSTNAVVSDHSTVKAFIGNAARVAMVGSAGAVAINAINATRQKASADSNAGGLIAAGVA